jgi:hypothetical protein
MLAGAARFKSRTLLEQMGNSKLGTIETYTSYLQMAG